jgi:hypothetical protein
MSGGALDASVTLDEVLTVVGARRVALAPELAGYLVLEIAEQSDPQGGDIDARNVFVGEEGTVALVRAKRDAATGDAESSIRTVLARLLDASGSQTPSLTAASRRRSGGGLGPLVDELEAALIPVNRSAGRRALARLAREVKRVTLGVGRHTLPASSPRPIVRDAASPPPPPSAARFSREEDPTTARSHIPSELLERGAPPAWSEMPTTEFVPGGRAPSPSETDVDALIAQFGVSGSSDQQHARALGAIVGLEPTPPLPAAGSKASRTPLPPSAHAVESTEEADLDALLGMQDRVSALSRPTPRARPPMAAPAPGSPLVVVTPSAPGVTTGAGPSVSLRARERYDMAVASEARQMATQPSQLKKNRTSLPSPAQTSGGRTAAALVVLALAAVGGGSYAVWRLRPAPAATGEGARAEALASALPVQETPPSCLGTLVITDVADHAEVLLREGQAPIDIPRMPVGARLEFVATAEGFAPKRIVVPARMAWDPGSDGKPRFEAAVQLDGSQGHSGQVDSWPAGEPGSEVGGQGRPGTVHVVATPRGAEVWMLAGIAPEARIEQVRCEKDIDVLLAGPTTYRKRMHVTAADFVAESDAGPGRVRTARLSAK